MSMITFEELKTKYQNKLTQESEVSYKVLLKLKDGYLVDINDDWEGFIPNSHILNGLENEQALQETFKALVISGSDKSDRYVVSPKALKEKFVWENLQKLKEENKSLRVLISKVIKGGAEVYIEGIRAFLPGRYIKLVGISQDNWVNQEIDVLIEELDYKEKKIILNQRKAVDLEKQQKAEVAIQKLNEGDMVEAAILRIANFGVFVDLGGLDGLIPASELSWGRFNHPKEIVKVGQTLRARVFRIEKENCRVALSVKQLLGDPWDQIDSDWEVGREIAGKVVSEAPFGLFIELMPGVEGLLHNSEIPEGAEKPRTGSIITTKIIKIDLDQRKVGLSLRGVEQETEPASPRTKEATIQEQETEALEKQQTDNIEQVLEEKDEELSLVTHQISLDNLPLCNLEITEEPTNEGQI